MISYTNVSVRFLRPLPKKVVHVKSSLPHTLPYSTILAMYSFAPTSNGGVSLRVPKKELVTGNCRGRLRLSRKSVHDFMVESEVLLKGLSIPIPSFDGFPPQVNICPDNSSKVISSLLGAPGESQADDNKCKNHLTDDLVENIRSTLHSLGLHYGGGWDKKLTKMHAICGMLKDEKMISTILEGSRLKLPGYGSSHLGAERAVVELLIEVARDLHCEGFCQKA